MWQLRAAHWKHTWASGGLPVADEVGLQPTHAMSVIMRDHECTIRREIGRLTKVWKPKTGKWSLNFLVFGILVILFSSQGQGHGFIGIVQPLLLVSEYLLNLPLITDPVWEDFFMCYSSSFWIKRHRANTRGVDRKVQSDKISLPVIDFCLIFRANHFPGKSWKRCKKEKNHCDCSTLATKSYCQWLNATGILHNTSIRHSKTPLLKDEEWLFHFKFTFLILIPLCCPTYGTLSKVPHASLTPPIQPSHLFGGLAFLQQ